ncbi:MAG: CYTH domain-containing protein [Gammaproteobacteria bacterium]|nr:CYTH domain-containing protein [Gammaproteobacteria bacterium]
MGVEIERKFLVQNNHWRLSADGGTRFIQGYLLGAKHASVRVRIEGPAALLNIKSATLGMRRQEYEYTIPMDDARAMLKDLCEQPLIEKIRYRVSHQSTHWEVDVFEGDNAGLIVAEIELHDEQQAIVLPPWVGKEVTADPRYYNVNLVKLPYKLWS